MARTHFSGPVQSAAGFRAGASGTDIALIEKSVTVSVVVPAIAASSQSDVSLAITDALPGDILMVTPPNAAMEAGLIVGAAWCSVAGTVKVRLVNLKSGAALTGSTSNWALLLVR